MTDPAPSPEAAASVGPFLAFGLVAAVAAGGAVWEMSYYAGSSAFSSAALGTTVGIILALVAFFAYGSHGPANE